MIQDCTGKPATVGQVVAYGQAGAGAKPLLTGVIIRVHPKTVEIETDVDAEPWELSHHPSGMKTVNHLRASECYVVVA